MAENIRQ